MIKEVFAERQLFFILLIMRITAAIALMPVMTSANARQDAWIAALISFFFAGTLVWLLSSLAIRFPQKTLMEYSEVLLGKWPGKCVSLIVLWAFLYLAATDARVYAEVLVTGFLTETPIPFTVALIILPAAMAAYSGLEVIGRSADLLFPAVMTMILLVLILPLTQAPRFGQNLEPVFAQGLTPILWATVTPTAVVAQYLVLGVLVPQLRQPTQARRLALGALGLATVILSATVLVTIGVLGPDRSARSVFPLFAMVRSLFISEFLERGEVLVIFAWGIGLFVGLAVSLWCGAYGLAQVFGIQEYRPLIPPMAVIWIVMSLYLYQDVFHVMNYFRPTVAALHTAIVLLIPLGLLWGGYIIRTLLGERFYG